MIPKGIGITNTHSAVQTDCSNEALAFAGMGPRKVVGKFDGGRMSSDGGSLLFREVEQKFNVIARLRHFGNPPWRSQGKETNR